MRVDCVYQGQQRSFDDLDVGTLSTDDQIIQELGQALGTSLSNWRVDPPASLRNANTQFVIVRPEAVHG